MENTSDYYFRYSKDFKKIFYSSFTNKRISKKFIPKHFIDQIKEDKLENNFQSVNYLEHIKSKLLKQLENVNEQINKKREATKEEILFEDFKNHIIYQKENGEICYHKK